MDRCPGIRQHLPNLLHDNHFTSTTLRISTFPPISRKALLLPWIIRFGLLSVPARTMASRGDGQPAVEIVSPGFMVN